ncbi:hypothetical protein [Vibrio phage vB_VpaP_SJSY21]|nr:hypothetical protein [Vibrio phage vB_VpaP_SJSY21]
MSPIKFIIAVVVTFFAAKGAFFASILGFGILEASTPVFIGGTLVTVLLTVCLSWNLVDKKVAG